MAGLPVGATTPGTRLEPWMLVGLLLMLVVGVAVVVLWRHRGSAQAAGTASAGSVAGGGSGAANRTRTGSGADAEPAVADEEFLPDDERVVAILQQNGGRMRQSAIVTETDWSKSKVSMLLSEMEEDDDITRLRVGRENIVSLPGYEPEATRSPYDES